MGIYLPGGGTLDCVAWPGAGIASSQGIPPNVYSPCVNLGPSVPPLLPPLSTTMHLLTFLTISMSLCPPTHLDECGFFKSFVVGLPYSLILMVLGVRCFET